MNNTFSKCYARYQDRTPFGVAVAEVNPTTQKINIGMSLVHATKDNFNKTLGDEIAIGRMKSGKISIPLCEDEGSLIHEVLDVFNNPDHIIFIEEMWPQIEFVVLRAARFHRKHNTNEFKQ